MFTHTAMWFERFIKGVELRVGRVSHPDQVIIIDIMIKMIKNMKNEVRKLGQGARYHAPIKQGAYLTSFFPLPPEAMKDFWIIQQGSGISTRANMGRILISFCLYWVL